MGYFWTIFFSLLGLLAGFGIPKISILLINKKLAIKKLTRTPNYLDQRWFLLSIAVVDGVLWGIIGYAAPDALQGFLIGCLVVSGILFTIIDLCIHIIPNELLLITGVLGILYQLAAFDFIHLLYALACMVVIFSIFLILGLIIGLHKIGAGDVKLAGIMGLVLGFPNIFYGLLIMAVSLIVYSIVGISIGKLTHVSMFPFAPFLMLGMLGALGLMLFPDFIAMWV